MTARRQPRIGFDYEDSAGMPCCGIDEAGRGPLAGPVVAAAVTLDRANLPKSILKTINDSKKLTPQRRAEIAAVLPDYADTAIGVCSVAEIDTMNILRASLEAMRRAYAGLQSPPPLALIDGNQKPPIMSCTLKTVVSGDALSFSIAAASILAKVHRDKIMQDLAEAHPHYGWARNAGYGTRQHLEAIEIHGITDHHRRSFSPITKQLVKLNAVNN